MRGSRSKSVGVVAALAIAVTTLMAPIAMAATEAPPSPTQPPSTTSSSSATPTAPTTTIVQNETPTVVLLASRTSYRENALFTPILFTLVYLDDRQLARGTLELFIDTMSYGEFRTNGIRLIQVPRGLTSGAHRLYVNFDPDSASVNEAMSNFIDLEVRP
jgi:hypothetical protein